MELTPHGGPQHPDPRGVLRGGRTPCGDERKEFEDGGEADVEKSRKLAMKLRRRIGRRGKGNHP